MIFVQEIDVEKELYGNYDEDDSEQFIYFTKDKFKLIFSVLKGKEEKLYDEENSDNFFISYNTDSNSIIETTNKNTITENIFKDSILMKSSLIESNSEESFLSERIIIDNTSDENFETEDTSKRSSFLERNIFDEISYENNIIENSLIANSIIEDSTIIKNSILEKTTNFFKDEDEIIKTEKNIELISILNKQNINNTEINFEECESLIKKI